MLGDATKRFCLLYKVRHCTLVGSSNKIVLQNYKNWKQQPFFS